MKELFLKLVELSLSSSYIILAILILRLILKKTPKWTFCFLWGLAGIRLVLPFSIQSAFCLVPSVPTDADAAQSVVNSTQGFSLLHTLSLIWLLGFVLMMTYGIISYLRLYRLISPSLHLDNNLYICDNIDTPFIFGIIKPKIYIPSDLSTEHIRHAVKHEYAHISRLDHIWKPLGFLVLALHWFNPLVILGYILLCRDIEKACDEKVISKMSHGDKLNYLESLVSCSVHKRRLAVCPVAFGEIGVRARVKLILSYKRPPALIMLICLFFSLVLVLGFFTSPVKTTDSFDDTYTETNNASNNTSNQEKNQSNNSSVWDNISFNDTKTSFPLTKDLKKHSKQDSSTSSPSYGYSNGTAGNLSGNFPYDR